MRTYILPDPINKDLQALTRALRFAISQVHELTDYPGDPVAVNYVSDGERILKHIEIKYNLKA